jgi:two-component system, NtrC family, nitrogen regulation response regulator GlnG
MTDQHLYPFYSILLVDDEVSFLNSALYALKLEGITNVETISDSREVLGRMARGGCGIVVLDITMPFVSGRTLLEKISMEYPDVIVFMITAVNDLQSAVECMKLGARDYIVKPIQQDRLIAAVRLAIAWKTAALETAALRCHLLDGIVQHPEAFSSIVTNNPVMQNLFKYVEAIAETDLPLLITGETGTGKELMAQAIHTLSHRSGNFVRVNVAGIDDDILSDTLFGHVRGAFTGAETGRKGLIEEAATGTLLLDEIGDLRYESQTKLLRLLQEGTFHPVGADVTRSSSARFIFATNRNLKMMMQAGKFRNDFYYRLQAHEVTIPPLRQRFDDMRLLANVFIDEASAKFKKTRPYLNQEIYPLLSTYSWPGNIRELKGLLFDVLSRNETDTLSLKYLKEKLKELRGDAAALNDGAINEAGTLSKNITFPASLPTIDELELMLIKEAYKRTHGNKTQIADLIGLARTTIIKRLKNIDPEG